MEIAEQCFVNSNLSKAQLINQKHCLDLVPNLFLKHRLEVDRQTVGVHLPVLQQLDYKVNCFNDELV